MPLPASVCRLTRRWLDGCAIPPRPLAYVPSSGILPPGDFVAAIECNLFIYNNLQLAGASAGSPRG